MIPDALNDGYTIELLESGVFVRQVLQHDRARVLADPYALFRAPWVFGDCPDELKPSVARYVLALSTSEENADYQRLNDAVSLQVKSPGMSLLNCSDCRKFCVNFDTGDVQENPDGTKKSKPDTALVPCETIFGCVKGHHSNPIGLSGSKHGLTWRHWWRYKSRLNPLSECSTYVRNAVLLNWIVDYGRDRRFDPFAG